MQHGQPVQGNRRQRRAGAEQRHVQAWGRHARGIWHEQLQRRHSGRRSARVPRALRLGDGHVRGRSGARVVTPTDSRVFPEGFRWGTATAAHQIEGGNWNNDWWEWEHKPGTPCVEPSGDACDSWNRWRDDVALCAEIGLNSYRFSIEWSRIEPEDGEWSTAALDRYRRQCEACLEVGIEPVVTFHHFTTPRWVASGGGWLQPETADRFADFCSRAAAGLADVMSRACTLNEPNAVTATGYILGFFPPGASDEGQFHQANEVFVAAHRNAVAAIRAAAPGVPVGLALAMTDYQSVPGGEDALTKMRADMEDGFLAATNGDDFVGVQTYSRMR